MPRLINACRPADCRFWLLAILLVLLSVNVAALEMSIIPLKHASAEALLPVIENQLGKDSTVSSYQNQIILNATSGETDKIRHLINMLDRSSRQLLISVKNQNNETLTGQEAGFSSNGINGGRISISRNAIGHASANISQNSTYNSSHDQQGIRASEGEPSFISTGTSMAFDQSVILPNGNITKNQQWRSADNGFYATAWIEGDLVSISIEQQKQQFDSSTSMNNQQLRTRVSGKLGEWIAIGQLHSLNQQQTRSLHQTGNNTSHQNNMIYLKVELAE